MVIEIFILSDPFYSIGWNMTDTWKNAKTYTGTLRGYRMWRLDADVESNDPGTLKFLSSTGFIRSLMFNEIVKTPTIHSRCHASYVIKQMMGLPHENAPQSECTCGLYAYYNETNIAKEKIEWENRSPISFWNYRTLGVIDAFGKIILHQYGFRAEKATIRALYHGDEEVRFNLKATYRDVEIFKDFDEMIKKYPSDWLR